jgi:hypothetical protein
MDEHEPNGQGKRKDGAQQKQTEPTIKQAEGEQKHQSYAPRGAPPSYPYRGWFCMNAQGFVAQGTCTRYIVVRGYGTWSSDLANSSSQQTTLATNTARQLLLSTHYYYQHNSLVQDAIKHVSIQVNATVHNLFVI